MNSKTERRKSQLTSVSDADSAYAYTYDDIGRVLTVSNYGTSGVPTVVLTSAYDAASNRTKLTSTIGGTADFENDYSYDNLNRLTRVDQIGQGGGNTVASKRVDFAYDDASRLTSIVRNYKPSGSWVEVATTALSYDNINRLTGIDHKQGGSSLFTAYSYTFDNANRITGITSQDGTVDYTYDATSQITSADYSYQTDESFTWDANGNRDDTGYTTGANNKMTSDGVYNYSYDHEGNLVLRVKISDSSRTEYTWDYRNRLTNITQRATEFGAATMTVDYVYDVYHRRIGKVYDADGSGGGSAVTTHYVYEGNATDVVLQFDGSNNLVKRDLWAEAVGLIAEENSSNAILWGLADNLGTVRDLVNSSGSVQNHLKYDAFDNVTSESNGAIDFLIGSRGMVRDEETGNSYAWFRYTINGRWLSEDPIGFVAGDANLTRVTSNSWVNLRDPWGLMEIEHAYAADGTIAVDAAYSNNQGPTFWEGVGNAIGSEVGVWGTAVTTDPLGLVGAWYTGVGHGWAMVGNAATFQLITPLDTYVNNTIAENGGMYGIANLSANIGVSAAYMALPCGYVANGVKVLGAVGDARDVVVGIQNGDPLQVIGGTIGLATAPIGRWCFVAGTQVVVGEEPTAAEALPPAAEPLDYSRLGWALVVAVSGVGGYLATRRKRKPEHEAAAMEEEGIDSVSCDCDREGMIPLDVAAESCGHHDNGSLFDILAGEQWLAEKFAGEMNDGEAHLGVAVGLAKTRRAHASRASSGHSARHSAKSSRTVVERLGLMWLAASLLIAGGLLVGLGSNRSVEPTVIAANAAATDRVVYRTKNIEDLRVGDKVLAWDEATGEKSLKPIDRTYRRIAVHLRILTIRSADGAEQTLKTTNEHPFWVPERGWVNAGQLAQGERLLDADGRIAFVVASNFQAHPEGMPVFNLRVEGLHTYFTAEASGSEPLLGLRKRCQEPFSHKGGCLGER